MTDFETDVIFTVYASADFSRPSLNTEAISGNGSYVMVQSYWLTNGSKRPKWTVIIQITS